MSNELQQQPGLFPLDPWGGEDVFVVVDSPHPAIARAMVGPLVLGRAHYLGTQLLQVLVLHSNRMSIYSAKVRAVFQSDPERFWAIVVSHFVGASLGSPCDHSDPSSVASGDSFEHWSSGTFWMPEFVDGQRMRNAVHALSKLLSHRFVGSQSSGEDLDALLYEHMAAARVDEQRKVGANQLLRAMVPEIRVAYTRHAHLSTGMVNRLVAQAQAQGVAATKYMLQAIQTESFGLLHLMAFHENCPAGAEILRVVCAGGSLPTKLKELGISKCAHRRTLFNKELIGRQNSIPARDTNGLRISGVEWLAAMQGNHLQNTTSLRLWQALQDTLKARQRQRVWGALPGLPDDLSTPTGLRAFALNSVALAQQYGTQMGNCLVDQKTVERYTADGLALYGLETNGGVRAIAAFRCTFIEGNPKVVVSEISGFANARVGKKLRRFAQSLADKWNTGRNIESWSRFATELSRHLPR